MSEQQLIAAVRADWGQVVCNGGPPCFHLDGNRFCLRAERWTGHGTSDHPFVSLAELLRHFMEDRDAERTRGRMLSTCCEHTEAALAEAQREIGYAQTERDDEFERARQIALRADKSEAALAAQRQQVLALREWLNDPYNRCEYPEWADGVLEQMDALGLTADAPPQEGQ